MLSLPVRQLQHLLHRTHMGVNTRFLKEYKNDILKVSKGELNLAKPTY